MYTFLLSCPYALSSVVRLSVESVVCLSVENVCLSVVCVFVCGECCVFVCGECFCVPLWRVCVFICGDHNQPLWMRGVLIRVCHIGPLGPQVYIL